MSRSVFLGVAGLAVAGLAASRALGSRPDEPRFESPLAPCPRAINCYRARTPLGADAADVRNAAISAVRDHDDWLTGRALRVTPTEDGLTAVFRAGPFRDDVAVAVVPNADGGAVLHVRSAARVGRNDLGLNRLRARRLVAETERRLLL